MFLKFIVCDDNFFVKKMLNIGIYTCVVIFSDLTCGNI